MTQITAIGSALPRWRARGVTFARSLAEAFPDERAGWFSGPYRRPTRIRSGLLIAALAIGAAAYIPDIPLTERPAQWLQQELRDQRALNDSLNRSIANLVAERDALVARLEAIERAEPVAHLYTGDCPDESQPDARDPACPACCAMVAAAQPPAAEQASQPLSVVHAGYVPVTTATGVVLCAVAAPAGYVQPPAAEPARPCRTCGPDGCPDSTACPREGGAA